MATIALVEYNYWTERTLWVGPTVLDVLLRVVSQPLPLVGMCNIYGEDNPPILDFYDDINRFENIAKCT